MTKITSPLVVRRELVDAMQVDLIGPCGALLILVA